MSIIIFTAAAIFLILGRFINKYGPDRPYPYS